MQINVTYIVITKYSLNGLKFLGGEVIEIENSEIIVSYAGANYKFFWDEIQKSPVRYASSNTDTHLKNSKCHTTMYTKILNPDLLTIHTFFNDEGMFVGGRLEYKNTRIDSTCAHCLSAQAGQLFRLLQAKVDNKLH